MSDSSSSTTTSSLTDGLSFILEKSSYDSPILENIINNDNAPKLLELALKLRHIRQESRASSSSRRPRKRKRLVKRDRQEANDRLYKDYFAEDSIYNETHFRCRFCMRRHLFLRIVGALESRFEYFQLSYDGIGRRGLSPLIKCTAAM